MGEQAQGIIDDAPREGQSSKDSNDDLEERKTVQMVEKLFRSARRNRMTYDQDWVENYKFIRGKQWDKARPSYLHSEVLNIMASYQELMIAILTDSRPNIECVPENPSDFEFANIMSQLLRSKWDRECWSKVVVEAMFDGLTYGTAISDQTYDHEALQGLGDLAFKTVEPFYCYPDPDCADINDEKSGYFITAIPMNVNVIRRKYPKKAHLIKSDVDDLNIARTTKMDMQEFIVRSPTDNLTLVQGERAKDTESPDEVLLICCYMKDETLIEEQIEEAIDEGQIRKAFRTKKRYPNGRKVVVACNQLLEDTPNPYLDGKFPFAKFTNRVLPREFWGANDVEKLKGPQQIINKIFSYALDVISLCGNPVWLNPLSSNVEDDSLINKTGLVIPHTDEHPPIRLPGIEIPSSLFALLDRTLAIYDKIAAIHEVSMGASPSANASGLAISNLQEAAQTILRLKGRNTEAWLTQVGQQLASRVLQFYSVPRIVRLTDNPAAEKYFKIAIDNVLDESGEGQRIATVQQFEKVQTQDGSEQIIPTETRQYEIKGNLDIRITTGTTLPFAKAQREARAEKLFSLGIYDAEDLLTALDDPKKEQILNKLQQRQIQAAQAAQMQQQAEAQGQPMQVATA